MRYESDKIVFPDNTEITTGLQSNTSIVSFSNLSEAEAVSGKLENGQIVLISDTLSSYVVQEGNLTYKFGISAIFKSRSEFVYAISAGLISSISNGLIVYAGDLAYISNVGSSALPGLPGFLNYGILDPRHHGAVADGVAVDDAAMQSWANHVSTIWSTSPVIAQTRGKIRLNSGIILKQNQTTSSRNLTLDWDGTEFICGYNRTGSDAMITIGDNLQPEKYNASFRTVGEARLGMRFGITRPPVMLRTIGMAQSSVSGMRSSSWPNTLLEAWGPQNVTFKDLILYSGGYCFGFKDASTAAFRRNGTTLSVVSGTFEFDASCVGKTIQISPLTNNVTTKIVALIGPTSVQIEASASAVDTSDRQIRFGSPAVKTVSGSNVVVIDGPVSEDVIGLLVGIPRVGTNGKILFARILSVNTTDGSLTLSRNASVTLDPSTSPLTDTTEIASSAIAIMSELSSEGGYYSNGVSQVRFYNIQNETYRGVSLFCDDVESLTILGWKSHGVQTDYRWNIHSIADMWGNRTNGSFTGESDASRYGQYRLRFADQTLPFNFQSFQGRFSNGERFLQVGNMSSGFEGAAITFDYVSMSGGTGGAFSNLVDDSNTLYPGYYPPTRLFRPDKDETYFSTTNSFIVRGNGSLSIGSGALSYDSALGSITVNNGFQLRSQAPVLRIQDTDNGGSSELAFQSNNGVTTNAQIRVASTTTGTGASRMHFLINGVSRGFGTNTRSFDTTGIPTYPDNAAALAGGLIVGEGYKTSVGDIKYVI